MEDWVKGRYYYFDPSNMSNIMYLKYKQYRYYNVISL